MDYNFKTFDYEKIKTNEKFYWDILNPLIGLNTHTYTDF